MADLFYGLKPFTPFVAMDPPEKKPGSGFYGSITIVRTVDLDAGKNIAVIPANFRERERISLGTVEFWALDAQGQIKINVVSVNPDGFVLHLDRFCNEECKVRSSWKYMHLYGY